MLAMTILTLYVQDLIRREREQGFNPVGIMLGAIEKAVLSEYLRNNGVTTKDTTKDQFLGLDVVFVQDYSKCNLVFSNFNHLKG